MIVESRKCKVIIWMKQTNLRYPKEFRCGAKGGASVAHRCNVKAQVHGVNMAQRWRIDRDGGALEAEDNIR